MRMKMFAAESFIILSERQINGRVEVRAATDGTRRSGPDRPIFLRNEHRDDPLKNSALIQRLRDALSWHGAPKRFADRIISAANHKLTEPVEAMTTGLKDIIGYNPIASRPDRNIVLVGPPGHGRTSTAAKLTRRAAIAKSRILPIAADFDATAAGHQLSAYLVRERAQVRVASDPDALFSVIDEVNRNNERCVIDLPSILPFDREDLSRLKDLVAAIDAEPVLVLSAEGHPEDQAEAAKSYATVGIQRAILTKLDVARRRGGAIAALASARISLSHLAVTPFIGGGLVPAAPSRLATLLIEESQGRDALKGAA